MVCVSGYAGAAVMTLEKARSLQKNKKQKNYNNNYNCTTTTTNEVVKIILIVWEYGNLYHNNNDKDRETISLESEWLFFQLFNDKNIHSQWESILLNV